MIETFQMPNLLDDNYQCIMGNYNLFQIVFYGLTVIWATRELQKMNLPMFKQGDSKVQTSWKEVADHPLILLSIIRWSAPLKAFQAKVKSRFLHIFPPPPFQCSQNLKSPPAPETYIKYFHRTLRQKKFPNKNKALTGKSHLHNNLVRLDVATSRIYPNFILHLNVEPKINIGLPWSK